MNNEQRDRLLRIGINARAESLRTRLPIRVEYTPAPADESSVTDLLSAGDMNEEGGKIVYTFEEREPDGSTYTLRVTFETTAKVAAKNIQTEANYA